MINTTPKFQRPLPSRSEPVSNPEYWTKALELYDEKKYKESLIEVIRYINPELLDSCDTSSDIVLKKGQGSAHLILKITDSVFHVSAPFLKITPETNRTALLRKVAEINFTPLMLSQIKFDNDFLQFEYCADVELCHPHKIYEVLYEIALHADDYDDEFVERYGADFIQEPEVTPLSKEEIEVVNKQIDSIFEEYKKFTEAFKEKRREDFQWDIILISIMKIGIMPYTNGTLRTDLAEYINNMLNSQIDFKFRIDKGVNFMNKLMETDRSEILKDMYHADKFISLKWRSSVEILQDEMKKVEEIVQDYLKDKNNFALSYFLQVTFLRILYYFNLDDNHKNLIYNELESVSGMDKDKAATKLVALYSNFLKGELKAPQSKKKGLFSRLFG